MPNEEKNRRDGAHSLDDISEPSQINDGKEMPKKA
jgi:hypothetical protein